MEKMEIERSSSLQTGTVDCIEQGYITRCISFSYLARKVYLLSTSNPHTVGDNKNHKPHTDNSVHIEKCDIDCREIIWAHQRMLINQ
jgi:hypothetical protein